MPSLPVACDLCHIPHLPGVSEERTSGSNPSQGSVRAVLPRRGWVGWIEEHSKILGAISVRVFVAFGGNGPVAQPAGNCSPTQPMVNGKPETGITRGTVTIGEILSDVNQLPQQLRPSFEGLSAWADLVKHSGGICGREVQILERNDNAIPTNYTSAYQSLSSQVFSFVATESLQDGAEYKSSPPFMPNDKDPNTGEYVPDVGGLAFQYPRAQSPMHAGIFGSLSP